MGTDILPNQLMPAEPGDDDPSLSKFIEMYKQNKGWYQKTEHEKLKNRNFPGFVFEEISQLRAIYEMLFCVPHWCRNASCSHSFTEMQGAVAAGRLVSPILMQDAQFTYEKEPKHCDDKKYVCPKCKVKVELNPWVGWLPIVGEK